MVQKQAWHKHDCYTKVKKGHSALSYTLPMKKKMLYHVEIFFTVNGVNYNKHDWLVCADFQIIVMLLGLQVGYSKHSCDLC